jgi:DNA-binding CsgD family transcriptional regulator
MPDDDGSQALGSPSASSVLYLTLLLTAIATSGTVDLILDRPETWYSFHMLVEILFLLLCLGTAAWLGRGWMEARRTLADLRCSRDQHQVERDAWRSRAQRFLKGLGEEIDGQMTVWHLTPTERETALLLLKGYSHKHIADLGERSERTVRQHAVAVYRKSGLGGRAELSAFFLEDLLLPSDPAVGEEAR